MAEVEALTSGSCSIDFALMADVSMTRSYLRPAMSSVGILIVRIRCSTMDRWAVKLALIAGESANTAMRLTSSVV